MRLRYSRLLRIDEEDEDGEVNDWDDRLDRFEPATMDGGCCGGGCDVTIALLAPLLLLLSCPTGYWKSPDAAPEAEVDAA